MSSWIFLIVKPGKIFYRNTKSKSGRAAMIFVEVNDENIPEGTEYRNINPPPFA